MEITLFNTITEQITTIFADKLQALSNIIKEQFNIPPIKQIIKFNGIQLDLSEDFDYYNIKSNDMLTIEEGVNEDYYDMAQQSMISPSLLHINGKINDIKFKAMIDTGAQTNIISSNMVKTLKLEHLIDGTIKGVAKGVGSATILGNIYNVQLKINDIIVKTNFKILDTNDTTNNYLVLLGLEFILKHCDGINFTIFMIVLEMNN
jgi:hypothetical protein